MTDRDQPADEYKSEDSFLPPREHEPQGSATQDGDAVSQAPENELPFAFPQLDSNLPGGHWDSAQSEPNDPDPVEVIAREQNVAAASLDIEEVQSCHEPIDRLIITAAESTSDDAEAVTVAHHVSETMETPGQGTQAVTANDLWRSLLWLVTLVLLFLSVITVGPFLVERYQYAAAKGKMRAQYEAATDMLSQVSFKDSTLASELVVHKIRPSVVSVRATSNANISRFVVQGTGQGSGVILSSDGYIVTNNHVVENADQIKVTLADRREYVANVVGRDRETDIAVLKVDGSDLIAAEWGNSNDLELGSAVWAMGSPFGLEQTVTRGIISGKHRRTADTMGVPNPHQDLLQTDAAINPGNSGGPLVNSRGEVIGINTSIYGDSFQGISFAVPSSLAKEIVNKLISDGAVRRGFLGVRPDDVTFSDARRLNLSEVEGALVLDVEPGSPADQAGLRPDDVITELDGQRIENQILLFRHIGMTEPGSVVEVKYYRDGLPQVLQANVATVPKRPQRPASK